MELSKSLKQIIEMCAKDGDKIAIAFQELVKTSTEDFIGGFGFLDVSKSSPEKISYVPETRKKAFSKVCIKVGDIVEYTERGTEIIKKGKISKYNEGGEKVVICKVKLDDTGEEISKRIDGLTFITPQLRYDFWDKDIRSKNAQRTTPGKIVQTILKTCMKFKPVDIDNFTKSYYLYNDKLVNGFFNVLEGEEIRKYYHEDLYAKTKPNYESSTLGKSCMRYSNTQPYLDMYAKNGDRIKLLVLLRDDKVVARSLIWYDAKVVDTSNKYAEIKRINFIDRIYTIDPKDEERFKNWAKTNNFYYKGKQSYDAKQAFVSPEGKEEQLKIFFENINTKFSKYPYVDTMSFGMEQKENGILTNFEHRSRYHYSSTSGGYSTLDCKEEWSEYHQETFSRNQLVMSNCMGSWILRDQSVQLQCGDYGIPGHANVYEYKERYYRKDRCVFSKFHNSTLPKDVVTKIGDDYYLSGEIVSYENGCGKFEKIHMSFTVYCEIMGCNILIEDSMTASDGAIIKKSFEQSYEKFLKDVKNEMFKDI